uniref:NADH-ubiquinone oxidoreductase chain 6 n=1 Tax=Eogystia hippophaecolus TaxID=1206364 RepID=X2C6C3_EOGHI|nr:NADH dehydrogenase subunit 6 [Eogystia hippophaecolus]AGN72389.1 NADH dehydrogenase subunit 6 [Eogystia hippophaecolus]
MFKSILSMSLILISLIKISLNHPLAMGLMILMQTFLTCLLSGMMIKTYWFSYILFLTFLGGLLVLFIYVSSIASNEMFNTSMKLKMILFLIMNIIIIISMLSMNNLNWMNLSFNFDMEEWFYQFLFFNNENKINLNKLYNNQNFLMMSMMIIYLFITLLAVVKITNIFFGPLRPSM